MYVTTIDWGDGTLVTMVRHQQGESVVVSGVDPGADEKPPTEATAFEQRPEMQLGDFARSAADQLDFSRAADSGDPEAEEDPRVDSVGRVTMSLEEYQLEMRASYDEGVKDGRRDGPNHPQTTERMLKELTNAILVEAGGSPPNNYTFLKRALQRLGWEIKP